MRTLTLRIENHATLENGGPVSLRLEGRGAQIGRKVGNDWVLPDPSRHISGHHFDIGYEAGQYVLIDVSSNGTFLHGERYRLEGTHVIQDGHRFTVGHYIIRAELSADVQAAAPAPAPPTPGDEFDDVWGSFEPAPRSGRKPASQRSGLQAPPNVQAQPPYGQNGGTQQPDYNRLRQASRPPSAMPPPVKHPTPRSSQDMRGVSAPPVFAPQTPPPGPPPQAHPAPAPIPADGFGHIAGHPPMHPHPNPQDAPAEAMLRGFVEGAGLNSTAQVGIPPEELGRLLGRVAKLSTIELMRMLQDRAAVKLFVSNEDRTMRVAKGNNPMKFMADANQAFEALFLNPRDGYQTGADGFENALGDVRRHQAAVIAAMQPALAEMLGGLAPHDIEDAVSGGMLGGGGRKAWDEYCKRWDARATSGENGMLDAFIRAFSKHYSDALRKNGQQ